MTRTRERRPLAGSTIMRRQEPLDRLFLALVLSVKDTKYHDDGRFVVLLHDNGKVGTTFWQEEHIKKLEDGYPALGWRVVDDT